MSAVVVGRGPPPRLAALASSRSLAALSALSATSRVRSLSFAHMNRQLSEKCCAMPWALDEGGGRAGGSGSDSMPRWMSATRAFHLDQNEGRHLQGEA